jgi:hypothetical protein
MKATGIENELRTNFTLIRDGPFNLNIWSFNRVYSVYGNLKLKNGDGNIVYEVPITDFIRKGHARTFLAGDYQLILKDVSGEYFYRIEVSQQNNGCIIIAFFHYILYLLLFITSSR